MGMQESPNIFSTRREDGVHYLTDYYSLLGVSRDADPAAIHSAYLQRAKEYHPDRIAGLAKEFQDKASFIMPKINKARETLEDPARRSTYDTRIQAWDGPISKDGLAVIDLNIPFYGMETSDDAMDFAASVAEQARTVIGQDDDTLKLIETLYKNTPSPEGIVKIMYEEALEKKQTALTIEEDEIRDVMRIPITPNANPPLAYLTAAEGAVSARRRSFEKQVEARLHLIESGEVPLLEGEMLRIVPGADIRADDLEIDTIRGDMLASYDFQAARILKLAQEREEIMGKRLDLIKGTYLGDQPEVYDNLVVGIRIGDKTSWHGFLLKGDSAVSQEKSYKEFFDTENDEELKNAAMALYTEGTNVMTVTHKEGLSVLGVLDEAVTKHFDAYLESLDQNQDTP